MFVLIDESGDLGWSFEKPYGVGGSSRFLSIAFLICPTPKLHLPKRCVKDLYERLGKPASQEIKATELASADRIFFADKVVKLLDHNPDIKIAAITVKKKNVLEHIRNDANKLYNYMIKLCLVDYIKTFPVVTLVPDSRSIKVKSKNSLAEYLQIHLWFELNSSTKIHYTPQESHKYLNLQFVDNIANIVWRKYEKSDSAAFNTVRKIVDDKTLFF